MGGFLILGTILPPDSVQEKFSLPCHFLRAINDCMENYHEQRRQQLLALSKEQLIGMLEDAAKNWLAHDGLWFLAVEQKSDMHTAIELDRRAWETFTVLEARRIMKRHEIAKGSGLSGLKKALGFRLYAHLNEQEICDETDSGFVFRMNKCRVQVARHRDGRPDFPCKSVGIVEYAGFAKTIDPRIRTECLCCPPDQHPDDYFCAWKFTLRE
jgi:hypothetical protein